MPEFPGRTRGYDLGLLESARGGDLEAIESLLSRAQPDMRDVERMTIDAIAERLSLSREAVKARLHRARKLMREYLRA
jgi:DNA-directed RNA polymerase specialized sigma24 family protein